MQAGYLFTDIEDSTTRWESARAQMQAATARYNAMVADCAARHGGEIQDWGAGDGAFVLFRTGNAIECALELQGALRTGDWSEVGGLKVRISVHAGALDESGRPDQVSINRAARILSSAWGGQVLVSAVACALYEAPKASIITDLGLHTLRGVSEPIHLFGIVATGQIGESFPPPRTTLAQGLISATRSTPLYGRDRELGELCRLLADGARALTILGAGGNGKTQLARAVGERLALERAAYFVDLDSARTSQAIIARIAGAVGLALRRGESVQAPVFDYLRDKRVLLVLDNVETALDEERLLDKLLDVCFGVAILAAGRLPLNLETERLYRLDGLACEAKNLAGVKASPAYALFEREALQADPAFQLSQVHAPAFHAICERVSGSPLALKLVAGWLRILSLPELLARMSDGVEFLTQVRQGGEASALRDVFHGSWVLLDPSGQRALRRIAVFAGGFDADAACDIAEARAQDLLSLETLGLMQRFEAGRFVVHPLIAEYAFAQLAADGTELDDARTRHCQYFLRLIYSTAPPNGPMLDLAQKEAANIRAAWRYANASGRDDLIDYFAESLFYVTVTRSRFQEAEELFSAPAPTPALQVYCDALRANCLAQSGEWARCKALAQGGLDAPEARTRAHANQALGNLEHMLGDVEPAFAHYEAALALRVASADARGQVYSRVSLAALRILVGDAERARDDVKALYAICRETSDDWGFMHLYITAGDIALKEERADAARANYLEALAFEERVQIPQMRSIILLRLGAVLGRLGEHEAASRRQREAIDIAEDLGDRRLRVRAFLELARSSRALGDLDAARKYILLSFRGGLEIGVRPLLAQALIELARVENDLGNTAYAHRLAAVLTDIDLEHLKGAYEALLGDLNAVAPVSRPEETFEQAIEAIVLGADYARFRL